MNAPFVGEADPDFKKKASKEELAASQRASRQDGKKTDSELERNLSGEIRAKYKIEVIFAGPDMDEFGTPIPGGYTGRTVKGPNRVGVRIWESGKRFHGGGDEQAFWCLDSSGKLGCGGIITNEHIKGKVAVCPNCQQAMNPDLLTDERVGLFTSQNLAKELAVLYRKLGFNADIYLKYFKTDVRYLAMEKAKGPDVARRLKGMHIYPLSRIIVDTSNGADLQKRFFAFLCS